MKKNYSKLYIRFLFHIGELVFSGLNKILSSQSTGKRNPRNILIIKTHAIGDVLLVTPSIRYIRKKFPNAKISMLIGDWSKEALKGNPYIDEIITFEDSILQKKKIIKLLHLIFQLRQKKYDFCIMFHCNPIIHLMAFLIGSPQRIGFEEENSGFSLTHKVPMEQGLTGRYMADIYLDLIDSRRIIKRNNGLDFFLKEDEKKFAASILEKYGISKNTLLVSMAPGGGRNPREDVLVKQWSPKGFREVAESIIKDFNGSVIMLGSADDSVIAEEIVDNLSPTPINLCGLTTLRESAALIGESNLLITNDSAPHHIAVALGVPSITIFGPTMPETFIPDHGRDKHLYVKSKLDCSPCYKGLFPGCKEPKCMEHVSVEQVICLIRKILEIQQNSVNPFPTVSGDRRRSYKELI